jgi:hypothetical protein
MVSALKENSRERHNEYRLSHLAKFSKMSRDYYKKNSEIRKRAVTIYRLTHGTRVKDSTLKRYNLVRSDYPTPALAGNDVLASLFKRKRAVTIYRLTHGRIVRDSTLKRYNLVRSDHPPPPTPTTAALAS